MSCSRPGKIAGSISPVEALRYQEQDSGTQKSKKGKNSGHRILDMAFSNMGRNKGKTILVVLSISLSIILLNSVLNVVGCFDKEVHVKHQVISDFNVMNRQMERPSDSKEKTVSHDFAEMIEQQPGVRDFAKTYNYEILEDGGRPDTERQLCCYGRKFER